MAESLKFKLEGGNAVLAAKAGKYLTFQLGEEFYGFEILKVQEIIGIMTVVKVPKTPEFIRGVINLRGKVIPVLDLRRKFELNTKADTEKSCIIVLQVTINKQILTLGTVVDEVSEVVEISLEQIENPPSFGTAVNNEFLLGMAKIGTKVVMLLDVDMVLSGGELNIMKKISK